MSPTLVTLPSDARRYGHTGLNIGQIYYYQLTAVNSNGEGPRTTVLRAIPHPPLGSRDSSKDFNTLSAAGNTTPTGLWSNGTTLWVADRSGVGRIYAYNMATKARDSSKDFSTHTTIFRAGHTTPTGLWSNGTTMWVADAVDAKIYAYNMATKARDSSKDFNTSSLREITTRLASGPTALLYG